MTGTDATRRTLFGQEHGFALPTVMLAMIAAFGMATAAVVASVGAQRGSIRDQQTKAAFAAAEAGVNHALLRYNRIPTAAGATCVPVGGSAPGAGGWCSAGTSGQIDRGSYSYWVRPTETELEVVSVGEVDGVTRRVEVEAKSAQGTTEGTRPFSFASVVGLDGISLSAKASIHADVATNGDIALSSKSLLDCSYAGVGYGRGYNPSVGSATCSPTQGEVSLPPVNSGDVMTNNSNGRICNLDPMLGQTCSSTYWNPTTKRLSLKSGASLTLGSAGGEFNYAFCKLTLNANSYINITAGAKVRIYFGTPEECGNESTPLVLASGSRIQPTGSGATDVAILIPGSDARATTTSLSADALLFECDQSFVLYAPRTAVTLNSRSHICGGVAAKSIMVNVDASITASNTAANFELPNTASHYSVGYTPGSFIECAAAMPVSPSAPDAGC